VDELLYGSSTYRAMTSSELIHWLAYDEIVLDEQRKQQERQR